MGEVTKTRIEAIAAGIVLALMLAVILPKPAAAVDLLWWTKGSSTHYLCRFWPCSGCQEQNDPTGQGEGNGGYSGHGEGDYNGRVGATSVVDCGTILYNENDGGKEEWWDDIDDLI